MPNTIRNSIVAITNYTEERNEYLKARENLRLKNGAEQYSPIHPDDVVDRNNPDKVNPTIGYGYNLVDKTLAQNTAFFTLAFGGTLTPTIIDALQLLEIWRSKTDFTINGVTRKLTKLDIIDGAAGTIPELAALDSLKLTEAQASALLTAYLDGTSGYDGAEAGLNAALSGIDFSPSNPNASELPNSKERIALLSMYYQLPELIGPDLIAALQADNRAEAWFQIRFKHENSDNLGLQIRKNAESNTFGLVSSTDLEEYAEALGYL